MEQKPERKISVRNLVEFILRQGNIDVRSGGTMDKDAMQAGARMHRKIQARGGAQYQAEVSLSQKMDISCAVLTVEGRGDGIITGILSTKGMPLEWENRMREWERQKKDLITVDEIKCTYKNVYDLPEPDPLHLAQAKCYAYIYARQHNLAQMIVQMTYVNLKTQEIRRFWYSYSYVELEKWFIKIIWEYSRFVEFEITHAKKLQETATALQFPYVYRKGQQKLAAVVYSSIKRQENLYIQAPTGIGKTLSTVFPAVKAIGEGQIAKVFYLTAKTITRTVAEESFALLRTGGLQMNTVTISAKDKVCILPEHECNPDVCSRAKGHFDRINECLYELITCESVINRERILEYADTYQVCPYELSLDAALWADGIICDYNYLFDPKVQLKRFFSEQAGKEAYLFLIDEAHNLVERGRDMYTATVYKEEILAVKRLVKPVSVKLNRCLQKLNESMLQYKKALEAADGQYLLQDNCDKLAVQLLRFCTEFEVLLEEKREVANIKEAMDFYFQVRHFMNMYETLDENYVIYTQQIGNKTMLQLFCVNPSHKIAEVLKKGISAILFSATLLPVTYYKDLLTGNREDKAVYIPSPFSVENRYLAITSGVTSKYTSRNYAQYERIVEYLREATVKPGNYMVFFSSYKMMQEVFSVAVERGLDAGRKLCIQKSNMTEQEREEFLQEFQKSQDPVLAFCILGGIFSEGIDLKQEQLIGAFIVGNGLPQVCVQRDILNQYFQQNGLDGFAYAYIYPGMNKVLQAAGRVIRTDTDKGVILLMDDRFCYRQYRELFPKEWADVKRVGLAQVRKEIQNFWKKHSS